MGETDIGPFTDDIGRPRTLQEMAASSEFDAAVRLKIEQWHKEYPDLNRRSAHDAWGLIAREVKKYGRGLQTDERARRKLITLAAMAKLGFVNSGATTEEAA